MTKGNSIWENVIPLYDFAAPGLKHDFRLSQVAIKIVVIDPT